MPPPQTKIDRDRHRTAGDRRRIVGDRPSIEGDRIKTPQTQKKIYGSPPRAAQPWVNRRRWDGGGIRDS